MSDQCSVWLVEYGEYSSYEIIGVYSTPENAKAVSRNVEHSTVREWPLDYGMDRIREGLSLFWVIMAVADGAVRKVTPGHDLDGVAPVVMKATKMDVLIGLATELEDVLIGSLWAKDRQHAIKIMNERRLSYIAGGSRP